MSVKIRFLNTWELRDFSEELVNLYKESRDKKEFIEFFKDIILESLLAGESFVIRDDLGIDIEELAGEIYDYIGSHRRYLYQHPGFLKIVLLVRSRRGRDVD